MPRPGGGHGHRQLPGQVAKDLAAAAPKCSSSSWLDGSKKSRILNS